MLSWLAPGGKVVRWGGTRLVCVTLASLGAMGGLAAAAPPGNDARDPYVVVYERTMGGAVGAETSARESRLGFTHRHLYRHAVRGFSARLTSGQVERLRGDPEVAIVSRDRRVHTLGVPVAAGDTIPPGVSRIGAALGSTVREPSSVGVAIVDSGIDFSHPDLNAQPGVNCVSGVPPADDNGHGTHVAGIVAARNNGAGVTGVAPGTRVIAVKVVDASGSGFASEIICGINWVVANATRLGIKVINMSLGFTDGVPTTCSNDAFHAAVCNAAAAGIVSVVAAGNDAHNFGGFSPDEPASYPEVLTATAMADDDGRPGGAGGTLSCTTEGFPLAPEADDSSASFSSYAIEQRDAAHTVAAPGVCVRSAMPGGAYDSFSGTSFSAPHAAGTVALCFDEGGRGGPCAGLSSAAVVGKIVADAAAGATPANGFVGDPNHPDPFGRYFGFLVSAVESTRPLPVAAPPPPPPPPAPPAAKPRRTRAALTTRIARLRRGVVTLRIRCRGPARCRGRVVLTTVRRGRLRAVRIATGRFSIPAGRTKSVKLRVARSKRRPARRASRIKATVTLVDGARLSRTIPLRRSRR